MNQKKKFDQDLNTNINSTNEQNPIFELSTKEVQDDFYYVVITMIENPQLSKYNFQKFLDEEASLLPEKYDVYLKTKMYSNSQSSETLKSFTNVFEIDFFDFQMFNLYFTFFFFALLLFIWLIKFKK